MIAYFSAKKNCFNSPREIKSKDEEGSKNANFNGSSMIVITIWEYIEESIGIEGVATNLPFKFLITKLTNSKALSAFSSWIFFFKFWILVFLGVNVEGKKNGIQEVNQFEMYLNKSE